MKLHEVLTDYISREVPLKLLERGNPLFSGRNWQPRPAVA